MTDFKIPIPASGPGSIHALNERARRWLDANADGIPVGHGVMVEIGYLPHLIEAARIQGFVVADNDAD
jgi:hypothetical protein